MHGQLIVIGLRVWRVQSVVDVGKFLYGVRVNLARAHIRATESLPRYR